MLKLMALAGLFTFCFSGCSHYYKGETSSHFDGERFYNPGKPMNKGFGAFLKWRLTGQRVIWPEFRQLTEYDTPPPRVEGNELRVSFVGHATVLIQTQGLNILTDPIWSERASLVQWAGPERVHPPGIHWQDLPPVDVVLISHNHYDHMDLPTIQRLWVENRPRFIVPLGNKGLVSGAGPEEQAVEEYDWGEGIQLTDTVRVNLEPMQHWSARGLFDRNRALWAAFVLETPGGNIYFAGDSGYGGGDFFREAADRYGGFRFAIIPMGAYDPRWFMAYGHMDPDELLLAYEDLGRPYMLPIHHMVFPLADTGYGEPAGKLAAGVRGDPEKQERIRVLLPGQSWVVPR
jgi:L-ascorbate metabolism protein UlaG (beta-lactamase superfamily)